MEAHRAQRKRLTYVEKRRRLLPALPAEDFVYLGDTARLPYGTRAPACIAVIAAESTVHLPVFAPLMAPMLSPDTGTVQLPATDGAV